MGNRTINEVDFVIFDTETTGLDPASGDRIIEIAGVRLKGEKQIDAFHSLVNPGRPISEGAFSVNHISQDMLRDAPPPSQIIPQFLEFCREAFLASYNANFDLGFLNAEVKILGKVLPPDLCVIDILAMARRLMPNLSRYALWSVAGALGIESTQEHRALEDALLTIRVFEKLKGLLNSKRIEDMDSVLRLFSVSTDVAKRMISQRIAEIQEAINLKVKLKIRYMSRTDGEITTRLIEPLEIKEERGRFYLVGWCHLREDKRTFNLEGILHLEVV